ncbi:probable transcription regulator protein [Fulvimarina pelagi HTCC2506]|uniref:Probable transcription regulator protein n=1 Tax=Fulvimarina pelagi HTCC2506 TaxID=314231 RepID=Q0FY49_9HYPH|nr:GntR family transcriptional regulator [Fulvimarina pelagi]EAU39893.1 probable transcription regulator protein [Fulvimarina pelagi HTCC2506]
MVVIETPDRRPVHLQIHDLLKGRLASGEWAAGALLPTELVLARDYSVSVGTVRKALEGLVNEGLIVRRRGKGTFVQSHSPKSAIDQYFRIVPNHGTKVFPHDIIIAEDQFLPTEEEREILAIPKGKKVHRTYRKRLIEGIPVIADILAVRSDRFPGYDWSRWSAVFETPYEYYDRKFGVRIVDVVERLHAMSADQPRSEILGSAVGDPILLINRIAATFDDEPVELRKSYCNTSQYHYSTRII